ncbi:MULTISPECIES: dATP/dGTP diphosphohydrolase domain-containing protein [unclassified Bradyrhizobium]|uniref:dATP/dGTP diphosphohydrolase domain-containing protein n=1 Tax=unclassified Bradyrhizobium TaxID=2631580 RepID=UPI002916BB8F|nr:MULTISPECIES: dATP/dGTP diphosphohydrolase domain-containing protein [unclassified Bradyrhizobium]
MAKLDHDDLRDKSSSRNVIEQGAEAMRQLCEGAESIGATKANNPKDAFGTLKACLSWLPMEVVFEVALALAEGGFKYGGHNYLVAEPRASVYMDACDRHQFQFWNIGEEDDSESKAGLHHLSKAIASLMVLRAAQIHGRWIDDRPPRAPAGFLDELNGKMRLLGEAFPKPVARYLEGGKRGPGRIVTDSD